MITTFDPVALAPVTVACPVCGTEIEVPMSLVVQSWPSDIPENVVDVQARIVGDTASVHGHLVTHEQHGGK